MESTKYRENRGLALSDMVWEKGSVGFSQSANVEMFLQVEVMDGG